MEFLRNFFRSFRKDSHPQTTASKSKSDLIVAVTHELFDADYYQSVFESIEQETGITILGSERYRQEIDLYKKNLIANISLYLHDTFSENDLQHMVADNNAKAWHTVVTPEYKEIIHAHTKQFVMSLFKN